jgi:protease-4
MVDVAASGGYYMSMACDKIVAESLTLTGSIGVVTGKFNLEELNQKVGFNSERVSKGKYAELNTSSRAFEDFEYEYFADGAQSAYESFRDKAALSRNKSIESMEEVAQGRVWTGADAQGHELVDYIGGMDKALSVAMELAEIPEEEGCRTIEVKSSKSRSPVLDLLRNSTFALSRLQAVFSTLEKLSGENVGYDASMSGFKIKDGSRGWDSDGMF